MYVRLSFLAILSIGIISCNTTTSSDKEHKHSADLSDTTSVSDHTTEKVEIDEEPGFFVEPFALDDFPSRWTHLEEHEGYEGRIIYDYCMQEIAKISFAAQKGDRWNVIASFGHDTREWEVVDFEGTKQTQGEASVVNGFFKGYSKADTIDVSFYWDINEHYCKFEGFNYSYPYFVSKENEEHYELVKENCDETVH